MATSADVRSSGSQVYAPIKSFTPSSIDVIKPANEAVDTTSDHVRNATLAYRTAASAFLMRRHDAVWHAITEATDILGSTTHTSGQQPSPWWAAKSGTESSTSPDVVFATQDLHRKLEVLRMTFLATLATCSPPPSVCSPDLSQLLSLEPEQLLRRILDRLSAALAPSTPRLHGHSSVPSDFVLIHPSLITAFALAALKLLEPSLARSICKMWFDSSLERYDGAWCSGEWMSRCPSALIAYERLVEVYSVHVLGTLEEWAEASDFLKAQSRVAGGLVFDESIQRIIHLLHCQHAQKSRMHEQQLKRAKSTKRQAHEGVKQSQRSKSVSTSVSEEAGTKSLNSGHSLDENATTTGTSTTTALGYGSTPSTGSANSRLAVAPSSPGAERSFSGLRQSLSRFLSASHSTHTATPGINTWRDYLRTLISVLIRPDPMRIISATLCIFALSALFRRRSAVRLVSDRSRNTQVAAITRKASSPEGWLASLTKVKDKVSSTVRMGTQVTYL